jgi:protein-S-isoprenylcysteine O-methyltransferase Ste14
MVVLHVLLPLAQLPGWLRIAGAVPLIVGAVLNVLADRAFKRAGTTVKPALPSTALVADGIFRWTRNPMYLGMLLLLVGIWWALGSATPALPIAVFAVMLDRYFVGPEEEKLGRTFGAGYAEYRARVRRWL